MMEQISQWLVVIILPITTIFFIFAGVRAQQTYGCSFDSLVLYLSALYNMVYMFEDLIKCSLTGQMFMIFIYTAGILYLFYNFELIVKTMEKEMGVLRK